MLYDVTLPIRASMPVFDGDPPVRVERVVSLADGGICNLSRFEGTAHAGTHIDAPCHFIEGAGGIETLPFEAMLGACHVADATGATTHLTADDIDRIVPAGTGRVLFKTRNGRLWEQDAFAKDYIALTEGAADVLVRRGVRLVGVDYLSVAPFEDPAPVHVALLQAGVVIVEGLDLRAVEPGAYELLCLPLLIPGSDGAPARVLLRG